MNNFRSHTALSPEEHNENTFFLTELQDGLAIDAKQMQQQAFVRSSSSDQLLTSLLSQVQKIDYRKEAGFDLDDEEAKLRKEHFLVITVEQVLAIAQANQWGLCQRDAFFYLYNGAYWQSIEKDDLKAFLQKAAEKMGADKYKARHFEFADQIFKQFLTTAHLPAPQVDRETVKINLTNGTYDINLNSQHLRAPNAADFLTYQLPFAFDPDAKAPLFLAYLNRVLPDLDCQKVLAEFIGYVFVSPAKLKLEKALLLYGSGANGKSVFFEIITALLGQDNVSHYSLQSLTNEPAYCRAHLANKRVNYASEINGKLEADTFKQLVSGEPVEARLPYGQPFILTDYAKLIFNCNELPSDVEHTNAYFRRFLIIPFGVTIPEAEQDKQLATKIIQQELSGVFNWVLEGLRRLLKQDRFSDCEAARLQLESYKQQSDTVRLFLDEAQYQPDNDRCVYLKEIYREYKGFCSEDGYKAYSNKNFKKRLEDQRIQVVRRSGGWVVFLKKPDTPY